MRVMTLTNACAAFLALATLPGPALAHAHLKSSVPAPDAVVSAPSALRLAFTETLEIKFTGVKLGGPGGAAVKTATPALDPADAATLVVPLPDRLAPGRYTVEWHAVATDTHKTQGRYGFTVAP